MIKLNDILKENLNLKSGKIYPEITLNPSNNKLFPNTYEIINEKGDNVGAVQIRNIDGVNNVVNSIHIGEEYRGQNYAIPTYVKLVEILGSVCSGEYRNDGSPTSFVSKEADNVWKRLNEIFEVKKIPIQGDKFRYCLDKIK